MNSWQFTTNLFRLLILFPPEQEFHICYPTRLTMSYYPTHATYNGVLNLENEHSDLCRACEQGHLERVKSLIVKGVDPNVGIYSIRFPLHQSHGDEKKTPLYYACVGNHTGVAEYLLGKGVRADGDASSKESSPLMHAVNHLNWELVELLVGAGADVNYVDMTGLSVLSNAIERENIHMMEYFLQRGATVEQCRHQGCLATSIPFLVVVRDDPEVVKLFIEHGMSVKYTTNVMSILCQAVILGHNRTVNMLLENGALPEKDNTFYIPLLLAARNGDIEIVRDLLDHGDLVNKTDKNERSALLEAAQNGEGDTVELLLSRGANIHQESNGKTAAMAARSGGHHILAELIENWQGCRAKRAEPS